MRNMYQMGGNGNRQQIFQLLAQKTGMSPEQIAQLPPDQLQQLMQQVRQSMQDGGNDPLNREQQQQAVADVQGSLFGADIDAAEVEQFHEGRAQKKAEKKAQRQQKAGKTSGDVVAAGVPTLLTTASGVTGQHSKGNDTAGATSGILGDMGQGAMAGSMLGPVGTAVGTGVGAGLGIAKQFIGAEDPEMTGQANKVGSLGTQLSAQVGKRVNPLAAEKNYINKLRNRDHNPYNNPVMSKNLGRNAGMINAGYAGKQAFFNDKTKNNMTFNRVGYAGGGQYYDLTNEQVMAIMRRNLMAYGGYRPHRMMNGGNPEYNLGFQAAMRTMMQPGGNSGQPSYFGRKKFPGPSVTFHKSGMTNPQDYRDMVMKERQQFNAAEDARIQGLRDRAAVQNYMQNLMSSQGGVSSSAPNRFNNQPVQNPQYIQFREGVNVATPQFMYGGYYGKKF